MLAPLEHVLDEKPVFSWYCTVLYTVRRNSDFEYSGRVC
jgi:hypothetical protein